MNLQQNLAIRLLRVMRYNKARSERAEALLPEQQRPLFHVIPFLLHVNHPAFPGFIEHADTPFGLNNYSFRQTLKDALLKIFPQNKSLLEQPKEFWPQKKRIESLVLMGSTGTIAQSSDSDFDYWVCYQSSQVNAKTLKLLRQKLNAIELWAAENYQLEVHFFPSDIDKVKANDFGEADSESSGSAQAIFLKAEFYTTNIVVAGKAPFWWLMPVKTSDEQYLELVDYIQKGSTPDPKWFMDLGNLQQMDRKELFGAAIWQISKAMDSPFKSVLKMAKLEVFLENIDQKQPLCNVLKGKVHSGELAPGKLQGIDPYALMFDELIEHYQSVDDQDTVQLLQLCLYIKCESKLSIEAIGKEDNFKRQIIASYVKKWGWDDDKIRKIDRINYWRFYELSLLSSQIYRFLFSCYRRMSAKLVKQEQSVSQQDMTVIGRKIDTFYSKKDNKIEYLRSAFDNELYCGTVSILTEINSEHRRKWVMYEGKQIDGSTKPSEKLQLRSSYNPISLLAWAVWNRVIDSKTQICLGYQSEPLIEDDLYKLTVFLQQLFAPVRVSELPRDVLLEAAKMLNCMVIVNFESRRQKAEIETLDILYSNSWGEFYQVSGFDALENLRFDLCDMLPSPNSFVFIAEECGHKQRLFKTLCDRTRIEFNHMI